MTESYEFLEAQYLRMKAKEEKRKRDEFAKELQSAFDKAENETAEQFKSQTCTMEDKDGNHTCPICYFRRRVKHYMGIEL